MDGLDDVPETRSVSIVDDDASVREATAKLLRLHGYVVHTFASAEDFLRSPEAGETGCLITDVRMPGMGGLALQERLNSEGRRIPTIFVTAFPENESRERALARGAVCFLDKPFDGQALIGCIERALGKSASSP